MNGAVDERGQGHQVRGLGIIVVCHFICCPSEKPTRTLFRASLTQSNERSEGYAPREGGRYKMDYFKVCVLPHHRRCCWLKCTYITASFKKMPVFYSICKCTYPIYMLLLDSIVVIGDQSIPSFHPPPLAMVTNMVVFVSHTAWMLMLIILLYKRNRYQAELDACKYNIASAAHLCVLSCFQFESLPICDMNLFKFVSRTSLSRRP
jgi:hypothetical protein